MTQRTSQVAKSIARILALVPDAEDPKRYLTNLVDDAFRATSGGLPMPMGVVPVTSRQRVLASALSTVELFESLHDVSARPEGLVDLGVLEWLLRPSLLLRDGRFEPVPTGPWAELPSDIGAVVSRSVCRIDVLAGGNGLIHVGTGIRVGRMGDSAAFLTNAHVAESANKIAGWMGFRKAEMVATFDLEAHVEGPRYFSLGPVSVLHPRYDLALIVSEESITDDSMVLSSVAPSASDGVSIGLIGHPSFDSNLDPFPRMFGFGDLFGVKRLSPGRMRSTAHREWRGSSVDVVLHDASTLSGSSGSCIFDLASGRLLAIHFGGWPKVSVPDVPHQPQVSRSVFESNGAVPLWCLKDDPFFEGVELLWS